MKLSMKLTAPVMLGIAINSSALAGVVDTVYIPASRDVTLYEDSLGMLANGSGQFLFVGRADSTGSGLRRRPLLYFDIAANVPAGAHIADVAMTLNCSQASPDSQMIGVHDVEAAWLEGASDPAGGEDLGAAAASGDATWLHTNYPTDLWAEPGGEIELAGADSQWVVGVGTYSFTSMYMAAEVQIWLDTPADNFGWALMSRELAPNTVKRFDSREHPTPANRPVLMVIYATPTWTTFVAVVDNTLYEDPAGTLSNGAGEFMFSGRTDDVSNSVRRGLVAFAPFNSFNGLPFDAQIFDARLLLHVTTPPDSAQVISLHSVIGSWSEGTSNATGTEEQGAPAAGSGATWLRHQSNCTGCFWDTPGGDFAPVPLAATLVTTSPGVYEWKSDSLTARVQAHDADFLIKGDESQAGTLVRFDTRESPTMLFRPVLEVAWADTGGCLIKRFGDQNMSGTVTSGDIIVLVNYVFKGVGEPQPCIAAGDNNCSGTVTSADIITLVMFVFKGGPSPCNMCWGSPLAAGCQAGR